MPRLRRSNNSDSGVADRNVSKLYADIFIDRSPVQGFNSFRRLCSLQLLQFGELNLTKHDFIALAQFGAVGKLERGIRSWCGVEELNKCPVSGESSTI